MRAQPYNGPNLFGRSGSRKYFNTCERRRFIESAQQLPTKPRLFCLMLTWSGARISEVLAIAPVAIDIESGVANIENSQTSQARHRSASAAAAEHASRTRSRFQAAGRAAGSAACNKTPLAFQPHDRMALCEGRHGVGRHYRHARDAKGSPPWLRREGFCLECAAASRATLARPRVASNDIYIWRRYRPRGARLCGPHVAGPLSPHNP